METKAWNTVPNITKKKTGDIIIEDQFWKAVDTNKSNENNL